MDKTRLLIPRIDHIHFVLSPAQSQFSKNPKYWKNVFQLTCATSPNEGNRLSLPLLVLLAYGIDSRCEDDKKGGELRGGIGAVWNVSTSTFRKPGSLPRCVWMYSFQARVCNCQILNQVAVSPLLTSLWNRYHQWFFDIKHIQIRGLLKLLFQD
jgi:hypothetical protein